ncbi:hypothetical protein FACS1894204_12010 [Synergistales bacterium]|nr:hypothetical protein FACS1894204_12010 [Synergistales bacterium]
MRLNKFTKLWLFFVVAAVTLAAQSAFAAKTFNDKDPNDIEDILQETAAAMSVDPKAEKPPQFLTTHETREYLNSLMVLTLGSMQTGYHARSFNTNRSTSNGDDAGNGKLDALYSFTEVSKTFGIPAVLTHMRQAPYDDRGIGSYRFAVANFGDATGSSHNNDISQLWIGKITKDGSTFGVKPADFKKIPLPSDPNNSTFNVASSQLGARGASDICTVDIPGTADIPGVPAESFAAAESIVWATDKDGVKTFSQRIVIMRGDVYDDPSKAAKTAFYYPTGDDRLTGVNPGMRLAAGDFDGDGVRDEVAGVYYLSEGSASAQTFTVSVHMFIIKIGVDAGGNVTTKLLTSDTQKRTRISSGRGFFHYNNMDTDNVCGPFDVAVGDFDGDGQTDLAVLCWVNNDLAFTRMSDARTKPFQPLPPYQIGGFGLLGFTYDRVGGKTNRL